MEIESINLPKGLKNYLLLSNNPNPKLTEYIIGKIEEIYLINKCYHDFDELKFTEIAIECAEKAKSEETFGAHLLHTIKRELKMKVIQPNDIFNQYNNMPEIFKTASFETVEATDKNAQAIGSLLKVLLEEPSKGVYLYGAFGVGKSHISACLSNAYLERDKTSLFVYLPGRTVTKKLTEYMENVECLVLDDLGCDPQDITFLIPILNARLGKPTIITSNYDFAGIQEHYILNGHPRMQVLKFMQLISESTTMVSLFDKNYRYN